MEFGYRIGSSKDDVIIVLDMNMCPIAGKCREYGIGNADIHKDPLIKARKNGKSFLSQTFLFSPVVNLHFFSCIDRPCGSFTGRERS
ncbi:hypothetical protein GQ457_09G005560 [Hibiscus cannabinus]